MPKHLIILTILLFSSLAVFGQSLDLDQDEYRPIFSGRIARLNSKARLMRVRIESANIKFLNRKDRVDFWNETYPHQKCHAFVEGRTNDYILLRVPQFDTCILKVHFTTGTYLHFASEDYDQSLKMARELNEILQMKRLAMNAKKERHRRELDSFVEKVDAVNKRYEILRQKLEIEWQKELAAVEEDKSRSFAEFKQAEARLNEIDSKMESYRIEDPSLRVDRWSLDPALYIKK
jgi:anion-transporting  ArsA/GET3 family ATPase